MSDSHIGDWVGVLVESVNEFAQLETSDGGVREARISGFEMRTMNFNGVDVEMPIDIELNGDVNDRIPISSLVKIRIT